MKKQTLFILLAVLAAGGIAVYYFTSREPDYGKLAADYFTPYPNELTDNARGETLDTTDKNLKSLMALYDQMRYDEALNGFNDYLQAHPDKYEVKLYRGIVHLKGENPGLAVTDFEAVVGANNMFKDQAEWYLGLAYLKNNQKKEAADLFFKISDSNSAYSDKAYEILNKIPYKPHLKKEIEKI